MTNEDTLFLVDGSSYIYRAYYAIRNLSSPTGHPTNAIYGFTQMLLKLLRDYKPRYMAVVFDVGRTTFRTKLYPDYKANRAETPDDLKVQMGPIRDMTRAFNIPVLELADFEADDIIGYLAERFSVNGGNVMVVTGDKDLMQIVTDKVALLDTMKDKISRVADVIERFGVEPGRVADILGLAGDASDNIPGVPGIGEKTAIKLLGEFGSLDNLLERCEEVKGKNREKLREFRDQALLSRHLATIERNVPLEININELLIGDPDREALNALFRLYGFTSLAKELIGRSTLPSSNYRTVTTPEELEALVQDLEQSKEFAIDIETTSLDPRDAAIVGLSFSCADHQASYVPVGHTRDGELQSGQLPRDMVLEGLRPLLENKTPGKIGQNIKFDLQVLDMNGIKMDGVCFDTMLASYALNPSRQGHGLDVLALEHLNHKMISYSEVTGDSKAQKNFSEVDINAATRYSCEDADATWLLRGKFAPLLAQNQVEEIFRRIEMPLIPILGTMENCGVLLDTQLLSELSDDFSSRISALEKEIFSQADASFNLNSPKQMGEILFDKMGLKSGKKTKGKTGWSTDNEVLSNLAEKHEIARLILDYRGLSKLKSTYSDALPRLIHHRTGRVHTSYNQTVTSTGRLSSSNPNLQNIPIRTNEGRMIRRAFIAPEGYIILSADYSQIELRVLAHLSEDNVFISAFENEEDIHTRTAGEVFGLFPEMVTPEMRRQAKAINFGVIYGQGAFSLAKQLGVAHRTAEEFISTYKERHSGAIAFLDSCIRHAEENGFVTTILGRKLPIPDIASPNPNIRAFARRNAINYPIQGSAADIIKSAMIRVYDRINAEGLRSRLIMQVHDELVFEIHEDELPVMKLLVEEEMARAVELRIPLSVDINHGANWSEAH